MSKVNMFVASLNLTQYLRHEHPVLSGLYYDMRTNLTLQLSPTNQKTGQIGTFFKEEKCIIGQQDGFI